MSKGISPIIAAVLLLAVTISIATIFAGWGPELTRTVTDAVTNQTETSIECNQAELRIDSALYNDTESETQVVISNTGSEDLSEILISAWDGELPLDQTTEPLESGNFTTESVSTTEKPAFVRAESTHCSEARDEIEDISE